MIRISIYKRDDNFTLVIWRRRNGNLLGKVYYKDSYKGDRSPEDESAEFHAADNQATEENVCRYFGFDYARPWWQRHPHAAAGPVIE